MQNKKIIAHVKESEGNWECQLLSEHLSGTVIETQIACEHFLWKDWAIIAAKLHDIGKYSKEFQERIRLVSGYNIEAYLEGRKPQHVDHSIVGAKFAVEQFGEEIGKLLAYVIAGHHAGLPNGRTDKSDRSSLFNRLEKPIPDYKNELPEEFKKIECPNHQTLPFFNGVSGFNMSFFIRTLYSCLVDADFLDTENFMTPQNRISRKNDVNLKNLLEKLNTKLNSFDISSEINQKRCDILKSCISAAGKIPGLFSLTVPTGGGKTLSSFAFALNHAIKYNKKRIIYVIPYTSIIEQNANVFREILDDDSVLEHHSNFDPEKETLYSKLATQNWDAPLIVTTNVQFFESLFSNKSSRCRKIHNIANSVVILDEAQMLPVDLLKPSLEALKELSVNYGTTILLCTATQPALSESQNFKNGLNNVREIIDNPKELYDSFKRVNVHNLGKKSNEELAGLTEKYNQYLCVVSTKKHARELFDILDCNFHLSSLMCPNHRSKIFNEIRKKLENNETCKVVSTQLIEAGVDVDFPVVFRASAGIDSIAQAAGRCNREGKLEKGDVFVFKPENRNYIPPGFLKQCSEIGEQLANHHTEDILSLEAVEEYFKRLFGNKADEMDKYDILQKTNNSTLRTLNFPFKDIAKDFKIINSNTISIIIPYGKKGNEICEKIRNAYQFVERDVIRKAQRFTVQLHPFNFNKLKAAGVVESFHEEQFWILTNQDLYKEDIGLDYEDPTFYEVDTLMV